MGSFIRKVTFFTKLNAAGNAILRNKTLRQRLAYNIALELSDIPRSRKQNELLASSLKAVFEDNQISIEEIKQYESDFVVYMERLHAQAWALLTDKQQSKLLEKVQENNTDE